MLFVATFNLKPGLSRDTMEEAISRHKGWEHPPGLKVVADYFVHGSPNIIVVFEASDVEPIYALNYVWADVFDISVHPAMPLDEAIRLGGQLGQFTKSEGNTIGSPQGGG
ncbi:MAG: hypothetical protein HW403_434 [Dehalococcoidia bacterium]|nr:hypothetical protein [Dehalococcoidia bacterium]